MPLSLISSAKLEGLRPLASPAGLHERRWGCSGPGLQGRGLPSLPPPGQRGAAGRALGHWGSCVGRNAGESPVVCLAFCLLSLSLLPLHHVSPLSYSFSSHGVALLLRKLRTLFSRPPARPALSFALLSTCSQQVQFSGSKTQGLCGLCTSPSRGTLITWRGDGEYVCETAQKGESGAV